MAPLRNLEHEADAFDPEVDEDDWFVMPASSVVTADHGPGRDDGGPLGQKVCRLGSEVADDHPKPTWCTPMRRNTMPGDAFDAVVGGTSDGEKCVEPSRRWLWLHGVLPQ